MPEQPNHIRLSIWMKKFPVMLFWLIRIYNYAIIKNEVHVSSTSILIYWTSLHYSEKNQFALKFISVEINTIGSM